MAHMVEVGRAARSDAATASVLKEMADGSGYERRLAVQACRGSGDWGQVLLALADPSALVVGLAIRAVAEVCDDPQSRAASTPRGRK